MPRVVVSRCAQHGQIQHDLQAVSDERLIQPRLEKHVSNYETGRGINRPGREGSGMAQSLRRAGHGVRVYNVRADVARAFAVGHGVVGDSLAHWERRVAW